MTFALQEPSLAHSPARNEVSIIIARRSLFVLMLLSSGAMIDGFFDYYQLDPSDHIAFTKFVWGVYPMEIVLAAWLVGRLGVWRSRSGWLRAVVYVVAYAYGLMLYSASQDWDGGRNSTPFRWPGGEWDDFALPFHDFLDVLAQMWLLLPVLAILRGYLAERESTRPRHISISCLIGWMTITAASLAWIRFLTWEGSPPSAHIPYSPIELLAWYLQRYLPEGVVLVAALIVVLLCWAGRCWWMPVIGLPLAVAIDGFGHSMVYTIMYYCDVHVDRYVLTGPGLEKWSYIAGRNFTVWTAFGVARLLSVRFYR